MTKTVVATGVASVAAQLVIVREFLSQFQGNEVVIALVMFNWLVLGGVGTLVCRNVRHPSAVGLTYWSLALVALAPVQVTAIRLLRPMVFTPGSSVGLYAIWGFTMAVMTPYALLVGFLLPYGLYVVRGVNTRWPGARIYLADNLGDVTGGALFAFVLVTLAPPMTVLAVAHLPLLIALVWLARERVHGFRLWSAVAGVAALLAVGVAADPMLLAVGPGRLLHSETSRYARLDVRAEAGQRILFADGRPLFGSRQIGLAEEAVHFPLAQLERVDDVLLISAETGMMDQIRSYHPRRIDYVEIDPAVARLQHRYGLLATIEGLHTIAADARAWLRQGRRRYDAILMNLPPPDTFQLNRFYTDRFFAMVAAHLNSGGVFCFAMPAVANFIGAARQKVLATLKITVQRHFRYVVMLPGQKTFFLCRQRPIDTNIPGRLDRWGIRTRYIAGFFDGNVTAERIESLNAIGSGQGPVNMDTRPRLMRSVWTQWLAKFDTSPWVLVGVMGLMAILYLVRLRPPPAFVLLTTGMATMGFELLVIFSFQVFWGYVYTQIGIIVTVFLAGLLPGAWLSWRWHPRPIRALMVCDAAMMALLGGFGTAVVLMADTLPVAAYMAFGFVMSLACGFQIPVALTAMGDDNRAATAAFSADLIGAAAGAVLTSLLLVPFWGLTGAAVALVAVKLTSLVVMGRQYAKG